MWVLLVRVRLYVHNAHLNWRFGAAPGARRAVPKARIQTFAAWSGTKIKGSACSGGRWPKTIHFRGVWGLTPPEVKHGVLLVGDLGHTACTSGGLGSRNIHFRRARV